MYYRGWSRTIKKLYVAFHLIYNEHKMYDVCVRFYMEGIEYAKMKQQ